MNPYPWRKVRDRGNVVLKSEVTKDRYHVKLVSAWSFAHQTTRLSCLESLTRVLYFRAGQPFITYLDTPLLNPPSSPFRVRHYGKLQEISNPLHSYQRSIGADISTFQTSIGTGYDLTNSVFSPDGRNFQVEYAVKAVENGGTSIGIRCKDGVVLAVEKVITSKLLKPGANNRIATIDRHMGAVCGKQISSDQRTVC